MDVDFKRLRGFVTEQPKLRWSGTVRQLGDLLWQYLGGGVQWTETAGSRSVAWHRSTGTSVSVCGRTRVVQILADSLTCQELTELIGRGPQRPCETPPSVTPPREPGKPFVPFLDRVKATVRRISGATDWERKNNGLKHTCKISDVGVVDVYLATGKVRVSGRGRVAQQLREILEPNRPHERRKGGLAPDCEKKAKPRHSAERARPQKKAPVPAKWTAEQMHEPW